MKNLKQSISKDGYSLYEVSIKDKKEYLVDKNCYEKSIQNLVDDVEDIYYNSIIIIFGLDAGNYLKKLEENLCECNQVVIVEANEDIYKIERYKIKNENIKLIPFKEKIIEETLRGIINYTNFNRIHLHSFGNYEKVYDKEYKMFIEILDRIYCSSFSAIQFSNQFKQILFENMISNLKQLNNSSPLNSYLNINKDIPAIIVSAGPSLDKNIKTMIKYKNYLNKFFIIAGNRTYGSLIENGIIPNLVISLDPAPINYDMMKKYLNSDVPFAFYEYSNKDLVKEYMGPKIYISELFSKTIKDLKDLTGTYIGGSVAHTCIDTARMMGCNPIILVGQDCAYTYNKHHSDIATFDEDKKASLSNLVAVEDVYGNEVKTTVTLKFFKNKIEEYIKMVKKFENIEFINASYGANIIGAEHKELEYIFNNMDFKEDIKQLNEDKCINIKYEEIIDLIYNHINEVIKNCNICIEISNDLLEAEAPESLMDMKEDDILLQKFLYVYQNIDEFEFNRKSFYFGSYLTKFLFDIRQKYFQMSAKDYPNLTSDFKYQSNVLKNYFSDLKIVAEELKKLIIEIEPNLK